MASRGKKKTTFAKLNRESKLRERRAAKAAKKDARKRGLLDPEPTEYGEDGMPIVAAETDDTPVLAEPGEAPVHEDR